MGPPAFAPLLACLVGGMGLLASLLRREGDWMPFRPRRQSGHPRRPGRFPGFDVLDQVERWDDVTAGVVLARLDPPAGFASSLPPSRPRPAPCSTCSWPSTRSRRFRCSSWWTAAWPLDQTDGWIYEDMPEDGDAWRRTLAALDDDAQRADTTGVSTAELDEQATLIEAVHGAETWHGLRGQGVGLWTRYACAAFYSHPWAWNEIGFGGPAYPRGYQALGVDKREHWEVADDHERRPGALGRPGRARQRRPRPHRRRRPHGPREPLSDTTIRRRNESAWLLPGGQDRTNHRLRADMRRFADDDELDIVIVGCGAGGATLLQRLARAGWRVVALDAGPFWDPDTDWVSDELGSHRLYWTEPRVISGADPVPLGSNNSGRGVGGSMVHYAGYTPRFHPSDFQTYSPTGSEPTGRSATTTSAATTRRSKRSCRCRGRRGRGATRTPTGITPTRGWQRRDLPAGRSGGGHRGQGGPSSHRQRPVRQPRPLHLPGFLPAGLQGQRQGVAAHHPCSRRPGPRG